MFNASTLTVFAVVIIGSAIAMPTLIKGFVRRGTGVKYEQNFIIQRAPQYASLFNIALLAIAFLVFNNIIKAPPLMFFAFANNDADPIVRAISWIGIPILISGMIFMVGGWMSLGESFSTDAEVLNDHKIKNTGLLAYVMHPAYSGIIQCLLGASIASTSVICVVWCLGMVAPLWLNRAKYEERLLIENLGQPYKEYADSMKWRRFVPKFIPIGV